LFVGKDKNGYTTWHHEIQNAKLRMLETVWFWSEEAAINTDKLLVAEAGDRNIAFLLAGDKIL